MKPDCFSRRPFTSVTFRSRPTELLSSSGSGGVHLQEALSNATRHAGGQGLVVASSGAKVHFSSSPVTKVWAVHKSWWRIQIGLASLKRTLSWIARA
jgi:hypothetical protein